MGWRQKAALIYGGISLGLAALFVLLTWSPEYTPVARWGGAVWVLLLSLIVTMPLVIPLVKGEKIGSHGHGH
ncbi:hypothetical protein [Caldinitratiruptor microaerophilus]|uniref:Uncharacterized protein n=1 Tax=Caldinitratiruptor microaerophilus TaxID=671077 RepID=A0AA35G8J8_9FIRM|nr:hypothetical protein [Caldinitratiruptor microaerophilus]BDG61146.1 hypothetical protein caldi_22360 [Caldinitratiruptor microaerophilus]